MTFLIDPYRFATAAFDPSSLFSSNKGGYWDVAQSHVWSDNGSTQITDGGSVYRIDDLSGNGNHWLQTTSANRPTWNANSGTPYIQFDGTDDYMTAALPANITGTAITGAWAARYDTGGANFARFICTTNGVIASYTTLASILFGYRNSGNMDVLYNSVAGTGLAISADTDTVFTTALDATNLYSKKDNAARNSSAHGLSPSLNSDNIWLMSDSNGVNQQTGRFQGGLIIDRLLDVTEMSNLATWLGAKQGRSI